MEPDPEYTTIRSSLVPAHHPPLPRMKPHRPSFLCRESLDLPAKDRGALSHAEQPERLRLPDVTQVKFQRRRPPLRNLGDESGKPLDGANKYTIHLDKATIPPVNAFWSITLYDQEGFQVANSLNRFAVSSWMPFQYSPDGSLDLYFQNESPGAEKEANWLPAPKGPFNLCMRLYAPKSEALTGKWNPPPVMRVQEVPVLTTQ